METVRKSAAGTNRHSTAPARELDEMTEHAALEVRLAAARDVRARAEAAVLLQAAVAEKGEHARQDGVVAERRLLEAATVELERSRLREEQLEEELAVARRGFVGAHS
jgi:hypothetical protein